jgi:hypothetical protein
VRAGVASAAERYTVQWSQFDNGGGVHKNIGAEQSVTDTRAQAPDELMTGKAEYVAATLRGYNTSHPGWQEPLVLYFRRSSDGWTLVGLERG